MSGIIRKVTEEVWNQKNPGLLEGFYTDDFVMHTPIGEFVGPSGYRQVNDTHVNAFSDCQYTVDDEFSAGDRNVVRYTFSESHDGELMGAAPTGERVSISGISISRLVGGKVAEEWPVWDQMGVMQQIGLFPGFRFGQAPECREMTVPRKRLRGTAPARLLGCDDSGRLP